MLTWKCTVHDGGVINRAWWEFDYSFRVVKSLSQTVAWWSILNFFQPFLHFVILDEIHREQTERQNLFLTRGFIFFLIHMEVDESTDTMWITSIKFILLQASNSTRSCDFNSCRTCTACEILNSNWKMMEIFLFDISFDIDFFSFACCCLSFILADKINLYRLVSSAFVYLIVTLLVVEIELERLKSSAETTNVGKVESLRRYVSWFSTDEIENEVAKVSQFISMMFFFLL